MMMVHDGGLVSVDVLSVIFEFESSLDGVPAKVHFVTLRLVSIGSLSLDLPRGITTQGCCNVMRRRDNGGK